MHFYWHLFVNNFILFMVSNKILAMQGGNGEVGKGKIPDPAGGHLSGEIKYPIINTDPVPSAPLWPGPGPASVYGHGSKEELSADQLSALNLEPAQNRPPPAGLPYHFDSQQHAAGPFGYGSHQQPHNLMGQLLNPNVAAGPSSSSTNPHFPAQYPPMHHHQQEQLDPVIEAFINNNLPITDKWEATTHYKEFLKKYKEKMRNIPATFPNVYPLSLDQLKAGISQLEILYRIMNAEEISDDNKMNEILIKRNNGKDPNYFFSELFYNANNFWTHSYYLKILNRKKILSKMFDRANRVGNADSTDLIELLVTSTPSEKREFNCDFKASEVLSHKNYLLFLTALCQQKSITWDFVVNSDQYYLNRDVQLLHNYYDAYKRKDNRKTLDLEPEIIRILTQYNHSQLRKTFEFYRNTKGNFFHLHTDELMKQKKLTKDHFLQTVHAIAIDVGLGRPHFFAMLLAQKLDILSTSLNTNDAHVDVQRILITRFGIDLREIAEAYAQIPGRSPLLVELQKINRKIFLNPLNKFCVERYIEIVKQR